MRASREKPSCGDTLKWAARNIIESFRLGDVGKKKTYYRPVAEILRVGAIVRSDFS